MPQNKKSKREDKHSKSNKNNLAIKIIAIIFIISFAILLKIKITEHIDSNKQEKISQTLNNIDINESEITDEVTKKMLQIAELQKENPEVIAWIEIKGTKISYPVCQTTNNEYYLKHTYKKEKNSNGSIFLDKDYDFSIPSENLLIYRT